MKRNPMRVTLQIVAHHPAFAGHFPGAPLLPGVVLLSQVLEAMLDGPALGERVGSAVTLAVAKFLAPVRPGSLLCIELQSASGALKFEVTEGDRIVARGRFDGAAP